MGSNPILGVMREKEKMSSDKDAIDTGEGFRHIVRLIDTDLDGRKKVRYALSGIKGIGVRSAGVIATLSGVDPDKVMGYLSDAEIERLKNTINNIDNRLPEWMMNRRKDRETGENRHVIGSELLMVTREDINFLKKIRCYRGIRHERGHKVRGQRTKSTGRKGPVVGVRRKKQK